MSNTNVQRSSIGFLAGTQFKNLVLNPHMDVSQRTLGTPITNLAPYTFDRWATACGSGGTVTVTKEVVTLADGLAANFFARLTQSVGHSAEAAFSQPIESVKTAAGKVVTLSFWAKRGANALTIRPDIAQNFGTGGSPSTEVVKTGTPIVLTTTWTKYIQVFELDSVTGKTLGSGGNDYLGLRFFRTTNSATYVLDITDIQLEIGASATEIERRPIPIEQELCYRYYETGTVRQDSYQAASGTTSSYVTFKSDKRVSPSISQIALSESNYSTTLYVEEISTKGFCSGRVKTGVTGIGSFVNTWTANAEII